DASDRRATGRRGEPAPPATREGLERYPDMTNDVLLALAVFVPVVGAFVLPLLAKASRRARNVVALILVAVPLACSLAMIPAAMGGGDKPQVALPMGMMLRADGLAVFMAVV